jgi:hypothetical protein
MMSTYRAVSRESDFRMPSTDYWATKHGLSAVVRDSLELVNRRLIRRPSNVYDSVTLAVISQIVSLVRSILLNV